MKKLSSVLLSAALVATISGGARGHDDHDIGFTGAPARWSGTFGIPTALSPDSRVFCLAGLCDERRLDVDLGAVAPGTRVQVSIRWAPYDGETDLDLFVLDADGNEVASSAAVDSNAESVLLPAGDARYEIRVSPANNQRDELPYDGLVMLHTPSTGSGELLPNLTAFPPHNFHVMTAGGILPKPENPALSCYPEETIENEAHPTKCLRFNQMIGNEGAGRLELRFNVEGIPGDDPEKRRLVQRIYNADGTFRDRQADEYEFHAAHGHIHYTGFGQSFLYAYDWSARARGSEVRVGRKVGFCVIDVYLIDRYFDTPLQHGARAHTFPTCNVPTDSSWMVQGIEPGWADIYGWNLPDQYIDITGVPDGVYDLEQAANPKGPASVLEARYDDNRASQVICIDGDVVTPVTSNEQAAACPS